MCMREAPASCGWPQLVFTPPRSASGRDCGGTGREVCSACTPSPPPLAALRVPVGTVCIHDCAVSHVTVSSDVRSAREGKYPVCWMVVPTDPIRTLV